MKQLRKYMVYLEDEDYLYKVAVPAADEQAARDYVDGNGEIIMVKDLTEENKLRIIRTLEITGVTE